LNGYPAGEFPELLLMNDMSEQQRMMFLAQFNAIRKDAAVGVLLAFFLGHFGGHRFYMGEVGLGILYLCFCWTGIPTIVSFVECFLMPGRVREYNYTHAAMIAAHVRAVPGMLPVASV
jgi:TM2 domain-containing membrane protein YozV